MCGGPIRFVDHLDWLENRHGHLGEFEVELIERFLIGSPAIGVTACASDFVERFSCTETDVVMALRGRLCGGVETVLLVDSAGKLGDALAGDGLLDGAFWERGEFIVAVAQPLSACSERVDTLFPQGTGLAKERRNVKKIEFARVDAIFRHLRNSLAHGMFKGFDNEGQAIYAFQDADQRGNISAQMVLSETTLHGWITEFHRLERRGA